MNFSSEGYGIESDMIAHFAAAGLAISEVPISVTYDVPHKHKKNPVTHGFGVLSDIVGTIGYKRPLFFFGIPGSFLSVCSLGMGIYIFSEFYHQQVFHYIIAMGSITALILGLLLTTSGLILNSLVQIIKNDKIKGEV